MKKLAIIAFAMFALATLTACTGSVSGRTSSGKACESHFLLIPAISIPAYLDCK